MCAYCTCMAGIGEACTHIAALPFTAEANTQIKSQFSCTSLPCSWLPSSFQKIPYAEISQIDFTTPRKKQKFSLDIPPASEESVDKHAPKKKVYNVPKPTEEDKREFFLANRSPVILALIAEFNDSYVQIYETGIIPKPLTELNDAAAMKLKYPDLLQQCREVFSSVSFSFSLQIYGHLISRVRELQQLQCTIPSGVAPMRMDMKGVPDLMIIKDSYISVKFSK